MRVRIWNAYASNNSGSYTIVGTLPSAEVAREVAEALTAVIDAHSRWREAWDGAGGTDATPLAEFCRTHGLHWSEGQGGWGDWPHYGRDHRPRVTVVESQVLVHHHYTPSLPPSFGEFFYKRGGRVAHEEDHAHHPIAVLAAYWWGWSDEEQARQSAERPRLVATLTGAGGALTKDTPRGWPAGWRIGGEAFGEEPLTVGVVFEDLIAGVDALRVAGEQHGSRMTLKVFESPDARSDPFPHLRPSHPPPAAPRFDVRIVAVGEQRDAVVKALRATFWMDEEEAALTSLPCTVARGLSGSGAEAAAGVLVKVGARVELIPCTD